MTPLIPTKIFFNKLYIYGLICNTYYELLYVIKQLKFNEKISGEK